MSYFNHRNSRGFTLIDIVLVLVLIGILAAVAVPKYFDLQEQAQEKIAETVGQEFQARLNGYFAQGLLEGKSCQDIAGEDVVSVLVYEVLQEMWQEMGGVIGGASGTGGKTNGVGISLSDEVHSGSKFKLDVYFANSFAEAKKFYHPIIYTPSCSNN